MQILCFRVRFLIDDYQIDSQNSEELLKTIIGGGLDKIVLTMATFYNTFHQRVQFYIALEKNREIMRNKFLQKLFDKTIKLKNCCHFTQRF